MDNEIDKGKDPSEHQVYNYLAERRALPYLGFISAGWVGMQIRGKSLDWRKNVPTFSIDCSIHKLDSNFDLTNFVRRSTL